MTTGSKHRESETIRVDGKIEGRGSATDDALVGIRVLPGVDEDHLAGSILRARKAGHDVVVCACGDVGEAVLTFADELSVPVLYTDSNRLDAADALVPHAREAGYPGVLWQADPASRVDFKASTLKLLDRNDYLSDVVSESPVSTDPHVLVGIPAHNEERAIGDVVAGAVQHADEVLVVDDGSDDNTVEQARQAGATVLEHETNRGYGGALKTIFEEASRANTDSLVIVDADGQHNPGEIPDLVETHEATDADIVIGSRFAEDGDTDAPLYRRFGLGVVNLLTNLSLGVVRSKSWIKDTQSGFRLYSRSAIDSLAADGDIGDQMSASTDILYHAHHNDLDIEEVGAEVKYDVEDASNLNPVSHGITLVMNIVRTIEQDRPVTILGVPGFFSTLVGVGFGYWAFSNYIASGTFPLGIAVVSVFFGLAGIFASFTAIILHSLNQHLN